MGNLYVRCEVSKSQVGSQFYLVSWEVDFMLDVRDLVVESQIEGDIWGS